MINEGLIYFIDEETHLEIGTLNAALNGQWVMLLDIFTWSDNITYKIINRQYDFRTRDLIILAKRICKAEPIAKVE